MSDYQKPEDLSYAKKLISLAPVEANAFLALKASAERSEGVIPEKQRELISLAVALSLQCAYCIDVHTEKALRAGASQEELSELVFIAAAVRAGAVVGHGLMMLKLADR